MSSGRVTGGGGGIPAGSKKMVMSLKEIVSCSEAEIYAALKECNMDPNEAVNRLLSQDTFQEVKTKKGKKKEGKDTTEFRTRGANRSGKSSGGDRYLGRGGSTPYYSSDPAPVHGRSTYKKENGSSYTSSLSSTAGMSGANRGGGPPGHSDGVSAENKGSLVGSTDGSSGTQPPSAYQSAWVGVPGQVSMADIVKMGRPQNKATNAANASNNKVQGPSTTTPQQFPVGEEWPSIEKPVVPKEVFVPTSTVESIVHPEPSGVPSDGVTHDSEDEEDQETYDDDIENSGADDVESISDSTRINANDDSREASVFENDMYKNMDAYQPQAHEFERHEDEDVGISVTSLNRDMQQLRVDKDDDESPSGGNVPSVVIPDHLQVQSADCSHLSFGSFGSVMNVAHSSGSVAPAPAKSNLEESNREGDIQSMGHPDTRDAEYYVDDSHRNVSDGNLFHRNGAGAGAYDASSTIQSGDVKPENAEVSHGDQYSFPSSNPGYSFDNAQQLNAAFSQTNSEMQNLAQFSNVMQSYPNSMPSSLLAANAHPSSESDPQYSPFPTQTMAAKYGNSVANMGGSPISMSEALKTPNFASNQPAQQNPSGANVATGPPLPQHLALHPYSQAALPLGHPYANMIGYPFLPPQSYTYMPSAFQQAFAGNSTYHQSLAAVLPQYKNSGSVSTMPQSASIASGFGAFGNNATIPGNFSMNPPAAAPTGSTLSYDDVLSSQYKDNNSHLMSQLQQNENTPMWMHGANSRTMSAVPASTYYNYQAQQSQQQPGGGFRQGQQPAQNYGTLGYPNFYHSQAGMSLDQAQNPRDGSHGAPQGQPKQSQIWQNSY